MRVATGILISLIAIPGVGHCQEQPPDPGMQSCYSRVYTTGHLSKHPDQLVTSMALQLSHLDTPYPDWLMSVMMRGREDEYYTGGRCNGGPNFSCHVECDGGRISLKSVSSTGIYVYLDQPLAMSSDCATEDLLLQAGKDDKIFLLNKAPKDACERIERHFRPTAANLKEPSTAQRIGRCMVSDPTGTPLNVRASPQGAITGTIGNGAFVRVAETRHDDKDQPWAFIVGWESGERIGWVFREFISCY